MNSYAGNEIARARMISGVNSGVQGGVKGGTTKANSRDTDFNESDSEKSLLKSLPFRMLLSAGLSNQQIVKMKILNALLLIGTALLIASGGRVSLLSIYLIFLFAQYIFIKGKIFKRVSNFEKDYTALLVSLASAVRTGLDPLEALCKSALLFSNDSEIYRVLKSFSEDIDRGVPEEKAIFTFAADIPHPDLELFRSAFLLARKEGSSLGECLHRLAKVTRQRQSFRRKIRSAVAMQKLSALGIAGSAIVIGIIQYNANPEALNQAFNHATGFKILLCGVSLIVIGLVWMLNISKSRI